MNLLSIPRLIFLGLIAVGTYSIAADSVGIQFRYSFGAGGPVVTVEPTYEYELESDPFDVTLAAFISIPLYVRPLSTGNLLESFGPASLNVAIDASAATSISELSFTGSGQAGITVELNSGTSDYFIELQGNVDPGLPDWVLRFRPPPVFEYRYTGTSGNIYRSLGLELDLFSNNSTRDSQGGYLFDQGLWRVTESAVPTPDSASPTGLLLGVSMLTLIGLRGLVTKLYRQSQGSVG